MKTKAALSIILLAVAILPAVASADSTQTAATLTGQIEYRFVGHEQQLDDDGRLLVWEATISGDIAGTMKWWFEQPPPVAEQSFDGGRVSFYAARWELWSGDTLVLAGSSAGKTVFADGEDGIWDGHGVVTRASDRFSALVGHAIYETGPVIVGTDPPVTFSGTGLFSIY